MICLLEKVSVKNLRKGSAIRSQPDRCLYLTDISDLATLDLKSLTPHLSSSATAQGTRAAGCGLGPPPAEQCICRAFNNIRFSCIG
jgi:hypothetical protein